MFVYNFVSSIVNLFLQKLLNFYVNMSLPKYCINLEFWNINSYF